MLCFARIRGVALGMSKYGAVVELVVMVMLVIAMMVVMIIHILQQFVYVVFSPHSNKYNNVVGILHQQITVTLLID
jgi:predicted phosphatase